MGVDALGSGEKVKAAHHKFSLVTACRLFMQLHAVKALRNKRTSQKQCVLPI